MSLRLLGGSFVLALVTASCTGSVAPTTQAQAPAEPGLLVVLDGEGNIITMDPTGSSRVRIAGDSGPTSRYFQPVWSPASNTLAWGEGSPEGFAIGLADAKGEDRRRAEISNFPFYLDWSPDGEKIGLLHNSDVGLDFEVLDPDALTASVWDAGSPFYFSWSPDSSEVVVHADGDRLSIVDGTGKVRNQGATLPDYLAPQWTPRGIFYVAPDGLTLRQPDGSQRLLAAVEGFVSLTADASGDRLAFQILVEEPSGLSVSFGPAAQATRNAVAVLDVATGEVVTASGKPSLGSFWSPDGEKLLMLLVDSPQGDVELAVWEGGTTRVITRMRLPTSLISDALQFSDQYAQSWRMWSPDSSAFALPGTFEGVSGVWVIDLDGTEPRLVSEGDWVSWSHE